MVYNRCGNSGLKLPLVSLGLWHNFGDTGVYENMKQMCFTAFDHGITHFDLANNYGPAYGSAERNFGKIMKEELHPYRDELLISTKAGFDMWKGPYGNWGSRKYLIASLDQSLKRLGLDYVDIFYHHRMDPETPLEETMGALDSIVKSGKALYVGLSNYDGPPLIQIILQLAAAAGMTQFAQCLCFDLTDTFTGNVEFLTYFFQRTCASVIQSETKTQYLLLSLCQCTQYFHQL